MVVFLELHILAVMSYLLEKCQNRHEQDSKSDRCNAGVMLYRSGLPLATDEVALKLRGSFTLKLRQSAAQILEFYPFLKSKLVVSTIANDTKKESNVIQRSSLLFNYQIIV